MELAKSLGGNEMTIVNWETWEYEAEEAGYAFDTTIFRRKNLAWWFQFDELQTSTMISSNH
jgi:hypothetical protein